MLYLSMCHSCVLSTFLFSILFRLIVRAAKLKTVIVLVFLLLEKRQILVKITHSIIYECAQATGNSHINYFRLVYEIEYLLKMAS